jgi:hypothetical protein
MFVRIVAPLAVSFFLAVTSVSAQGLASGDAIRLAIAGNTVRGAMEASGGFEEFYDANGTIKGADYVGEWSVRGDRMCFVYDGNPASCWSMRVNGTSVTWVGATGEEGTGTILPGNPRGY